MLLTTRATALIYQGQELGLHTSTPTRVSDVKDPIGITGWPTEKGRDGKRTPMQWDVNDSQAGFSIAVQDVASRIVEIRDGQCADRERRFKVVAFLARTVDSFAAVQSSPERRRDNHAGYFEP